MAIPCGRIMGAAHIATLGERSFAGIAAGSPEATEAIERARQSVNTERQLNRVLTFAPRGLAINLARNMPGAHICAEPGCPEIVTRDSRQRCRGCEERRARAFFADFRERVELERLGVES